MIFNSANLYLLVNIHVFTDSDCIDSLLHDNLLYWQSFPLQSVLLCFVHFFVLPKFHSVQPLFRPAPISIVKSRNSTKNLNLSCIIYFLYISVDSSSFYYIFYCMSKHFWPLISGNGLDFWLCHVFFVGYRIIPPSQMWWS